LPKRLRQGARPRVADCAAPQEAGPRPAGRDDNGAYTNTSAAGTIAYTGASHVHRPLRCESTLDRRGIRPGGHDEL